MRSQAFSSPSKRGLVGVAVAGLIAALCLLLITGAPDTAKGQDEVAATAAKKKKKKKDTVKVMTQNLYLGTGLTDAFQAGIASRTDLFADEVGEALREINANDFTVRARTIAKGIKKQKADVVGLQEAVLLKLEAPSDGGGPPRGTAATPPLIDYIDTLLNELNKKAKSKKACNKAAKKRKAQGKKPKPCFRGYYVVGFHEVADAEVFGDFDNDPGPNGRTCDIASPTCGNPYPSGGGGDGSDDWISGNDDTPGSSGRFPSNLGEPPAAECSDGIDNDGDGLVDWGPIPGTNETSGPAPPFLGNPSVLTGATAWDCSTRLDDDESAADTFPTGGPQGAPQDANMDNHIYTGDAGAAPLGLPDALGNGLDPAGVTDCEVPEGFTLGLDSNPEPGPSVGDTPPGAPGAPPWDAPGFDGDLDADSAGSQVPVCLFHGIEGDLRVQNRNMIIARKGAGVKASNVRGGNFAQQLTFTVLGEQLGNTRGWIAADMSVRGKKFHLVNTHLEDEDGGTVREDQARALVDPGGPAAVNKTVLAGDLNSDPASADPESPLAYNALAANGFRSLTGPGLTSGHGELLNDLGNLLDDSRIDHILTNNPSIRMRSSLVLDPIGFGLWASDHGGVLSRLAIPGGKKKGKKK